ncbi:MAG: LTA synthase family protein [Xanthomonadales bacterium]|nr:LTA synthase family protein [Xanthomonadales bacterium]
MSPSTRTGNRPARLWFALGALTLLCAAGLAGWRALLVERSYAEYSACSGCLHMASLAHDLAPISLVALLLLASRLPRSRAGRALIALPTVLLLAAMAIDTVVFRLLYQRMYLQEVLRFAGESKHSWTVAADLLGQWPDAALLLLAVLAPVAALLACLVGGRPSNRMLASALAPALALPLLGFAVPEPDYVLGESWQNVLEVNRPAPLDRPYSADQVAAWRNAPALPSTCLQGQQQRPDVIVLLVESLSAYHSHLHAGIMDATPQLDELARANRYVPAFIANGFHSDGGLISVFNGRVPIPAINRMSSIDAFVGFENAADDYYARMRGLGYETLFFTGGELGFLGKDRWSSALGFDYAEGGESPVYGDLPRGQFGAPEDAALLRRVLDWHAARQDSRPFFAGILTVHTHPPFVVPGTGTLDEERAFRHVDALIKQFHDTLAERGFFRHGMLIVSGDHRSMTPLKPGERARFGDTAFARVPMVIIGPEGSPAAPIEGRFQHTDLLPSILQLADSEVCISPTQGLLFAQPPQPAEVTAHASGLNREQVQVFSARGQGRLVLDGDDTRWEDVPPPYADELLAAWSLDRIDRGPVRANRLEYLWGLLGYDRERAADPQD